MTSDYDRIRDENIREYGEGTRHLSFLGRLYSDRTHFIYELLQNAEDEGATRVRFELFGDRLEFFHDGEVFDEADVCGICGVGAGTKPDDLTKIGRFGVGFKSVYAYTMSPEIHSGNEHFRVEHYVRPHGAPERDVKAPWTTSFTFPFSPQLVDADLAYNEIESALGGLSVRTLLFLRNVEQIAWESSRGAKGLFLRSERSAGSARRIDVKGQASGLSGQPKPRLDQEQWLVFDRPVVAPGGRPVRPVEIAFLLDQFRGESVKPSVGVRPLTQSPLFVFFATEKDTRLGFLAQGPYRTTPARDNTPKEDDWNSHLVDETTKLTVDALQELKRLRLLTVQALTALPIDASAFPDNGMFRPVFDEVRSALTDLEFLPDTGGGHVSGRRAKLGRGVELRSLLSPAQISELFVSDTAREGEETEGFRWLSGDITADREPTLRTYLTEEIGVEEITPESFARKVTDGFLERQPDEWFVKLYGFLRGQEALWRQNRWTVDGPIRAKRFLRLEDGTNATPYQRDGTPNCYLPGTGVNAPRTVKRTITADEEALAFLKRLGIPEPDIVSEVIEHVLPQYEEDDASLTDDEHAQHVTLIVRALQSAVADRRKILLDRLEKTHFLYAINAGSESIARVTPSMAYVRSEELDLLLHGNPDIWYVDERYKKSQIGALNDLELRRSLHIEQRKPDGRGYVSIASSWGHHKRGLRGFDPDFTVDGLGFALDHPDVERCRYIWNQVAVPYQSQIRGTVESSSRKSFEGSTRTTKFSVFGDLLRESSWLPDKEGKLHKPHEIGLDDLPEGYERDESLASELGLKGSELTELASKAGLELGDIDLLRHLKDMPEELERLRSLIDNQRTRPAFPRRESKNPERRRRKVREQINEAPEIRYEERKRSVRVSSPLVDKNEYLEENYENEDGQLICQMCEEEMPFRKRDGSYYFESVQLFDDLAREHAAAHAALCPLCAAKYKELVKRDDDAVSTLRQQLEVEEGLRYGLDFGGALGSIQFVETHLLDLQELLGEAETHASDKTSGVPAGEN